MTEKSVNGLDELLAKLGEMESLVTQKRIVARAVRAGAEPIRARAEELAPDDPTTPGSRIKEGMMITVTEQTATEAIGKIGPARFAFFGTFQEFGTAHLAAQPFLQPAFDEKQDEALKIMGEMLAEEIESAARKR